MSIVSKLLRASEPMPCPDSAAAALAARLGHAVGLSVYPRSIVGCQGLIHCLGRRGRDKLLCVAAQAEPKGWGGEPHEVEVESQRLSAVVAPTGQAQAARVREHLPFTSPQLLGLRRSLGCGDRLGLATPGHVRAVRGTGVLPVFAQQSIREMSRTERSPQQVMDSATWGVLQEGWTSGWGADADHLKTAADLDACVAAGFTMFTIDPGEYVEAAADTLKDTDLAERFQALPWDDLEGSPEACCRQYLQHAFALSPDMTMRFLPTALFRAGVKYGRAVAHTVALYRHMLGAMGDRPFELEVSVDETPTPTTIEEHFYVAGEMRRLGVQWVSLAPRFVGEFEKGVDYQGSLDEFELAFVQHLQVARHFGPYKISLHSGSDKFSIYPIAARHAGDLVHVKTAGTSYLEALRTIATVEPALMREILDFARSRYNDDKASYHVSADVSKVPPADELADEDLAGVLDTFDGRQVLHVTYGSVLTHEHEGTPLFKPRILRALDEHEETHYEIIARHLRRHAEPFGQTNGEG